jgi:hypothetical protein
MAGTGSSPGHAARKGRRCRGTFGSFITPVSYQNVFLFSPPTSMKIRGSVLGKAESEHELESGPPLRYAKKGKSRIMNHTFLFFPNCVGVRTAGSPRSEFSSVPGIIYKY